MTLLLIALLVVGGMALGILLGFIVFCEIYMWRYNIDDKPAEHRGMYNDPALMTYFQMRDRETDPKLRAMPLQEYRAYYEASLTGARSRAL